MEEVKYASKLLTYLSIRFNGDWHKIYDAIKNPSELEFTNEDVEKAYDQVTCKVVTIMDPDYPKALLNIFQPPFVLFYYGNLALLNQYDKCISVIGSRKHSEYGKRMTENIVGGLANDYVIISGMAIGIDTIAHESAINGGGKTIAILGTGIDLPYPARNKELYKTLKEDHLVISEYPELTAITSDKFPVRNRIIAGLSRALLITEGYEQSGSWITACYANQMDRDVLCVPTEAGKNSICNRLIKEGAFMVETSDDVREILK